MDDRFVEVRCPVSRHVLFERRFDGTEIIKVCACKRRVLVARDGTTSVMSESAADESRNGRAFATA